MHLFPPELLYKVLREADLDVLLPLLKSDSVPNVIKDIFEVVTNHNEHLMFWSKDFERSHLDTIQPIKGKQYLVEISFSIRSSVTAIGPEQLKQLLELNGFIYLLARPCFRYPEDILDPILASERLLIVGTDTPLEYWSSGDINFDRMRYTRLCSLTLDSHKRKFNKEITNLDIWSASQNIYDSIGRSVFDYLESLVLSRIPHVNVKYTEFSKLQYCELSFVSQMENLKFPELAYLHLYLKNNGSPAYLKDIEAPKLRYFLITTNCGFEVNNVVINGSLKILSLVNTSQREIEIKGLDDWYVTADKLNLFGIATTLRSKPFIQGFKETSIDTHQQLRLLDFLLEEKFKGSKLGYIPNTSFPVIRAPKLEKLRIDLDTDETFPLLAHLYTNITELDVFLRNEHLPRHLDCIRKLQKLRILNLESYQFDVKEVRLDSLDWDLPNLESFVFELCPYYTDADNLTIDMCAPKLKSLSVFSQSYCWKAACLTSLTLKSLSNLKELRTKGFKKLIIADNMGSAIESIESEELSRIEAKKLSNIKHLPFRIAARDKSVGVYKKRKPKIVTPKKAQKGDQGTK